jgi:hypothetical protein
MALDLYLRPITRSVTNGRDRLSASFSFIKDTYWFEAEAYHSLCNRLLFEEIYGPFSAAKNAKRTTRKYGKANDEEWGERERGWGVSKRE